MADWRHQAACRTKDPELFFPVSDREEKAVAQIAAAKAVCRGCPVVQACLGWALASGQDYGVWGGMTAGERRRVRSGAAGRSMTTEVVE